MGGGDGTMRERKKKEKMEENEKGDKKNRVLEWGEGLSHDIQLFLQSILFTKRTKKK